MKYLNNSKTTKKVIMMILIVLTLNFISPNLSNAAESTYGGELFNPLFQMLAGIGDLVIKGLQYIFLGDGDVVGVLDGEKQFIIEYSPAAIFSNEVPALDINFFNPHEKKKITIEQDESSACERLKNKGAINVREHYYHGFAEWGEAAYYKDRSGEGTPEEILLKELKNAEKDKENPNDNSDNISYTKYSDGEDVTNELKKDAVYENNNKYQENMVVAWKDKKNGKVYIILNVIEAANFVQGANGKNYIDFSPEIDVSKGYGNFKMVLFQVSSLEKAKSIITAEPAYKGELESSAESLRPVVATWYKALRAIALVGLLSVLVYIGIRILISSTGEEKSKYKKMVVDWVTAICILFVLQYIMVFTLTITEKITDVIKVNVIDEKTGRDDLISNLRGEISGLSGQAIGNDDVTGLKLSGFDVFIRTIIYLALVIQTCVFTVFYIKRLLYMAFFTMISPLVALTYPLDKINDGQAQAFTTLIREYVFNALIQPVHLLLYFMFITSAKSIIDENPIYAVVAIGFMMPAEKFFRKMFGFGKASSMSQLGAAAGGAMVMNAVNKMAHRSGKNEADKKDGGSSAPRTASQNAVKIGSGNGQRPGQQGNNGQQAQNNSQQAIPRNNQSQPSNGNGNTGSNVGLNNVNNTNNMSSLRNSGGSVQGSLGREGRASQFGPTLARAFTTQRGLRNGAMTLGRKYINADTGRKVRRMARRGIIGATGAMAAGTIGLAAGVATGDVGNAVKYGAAGAAAGYMGANYVGEKALSGEKNIRETFKEGAIGQQEYNNLKSDKEFYSSKEFREMVNNHDLMQNKRGAGRTKAMRNAVQVYRDNGITDTGKIQTAMKSGLSEQEGAYAIKLAQMIGRDGWNDPAKRADFEKRYKSSMPQGANTEKIWNSIESLL